MADHVMKRNDDLWFKYQHIGHCVFQPPCSDYHFKTNGTRDMHVVVHQHFVTKDALFDLRKGACPIGSRDESYRANIKEFVFETDNINDDVLEHFTFFVSRCIAPDKGDPISGGFNDPGTPDAEKKLAKKGFCLRGRMKMLKFTYRFAAGAAHTLNTRDAVVFATDNTCGSDYEVNITSPIPLGGVIINTDTGFPGFGPNITENSISDDGSIYTTIVTAGPNSAGSSTAYTVLEDSSEDHEIGRMALSPNKNIFKYGSITGAIAGDLFKDCSGAKYLPDHSAITVEQSSQGGVVAYETNPFAGGTVVLGPLA